MVTFSLRSTLYWMWHVRVQMYDNVCSNLIGYSCDFHHSPVVLNIELDCAFASLSFSLSLSPYLRDPYTSRVDHGIHVIHTRCNLKCIIHGVCVCVVCDWPFAPHSYLRAVAKARHKDYLVEKKRVYQFNLSVKCGTIKDVATAFSQMMELAMPSK